MQIDGIQLERGCPKVWQQRWRCAYQTETWHFVWLDRILTRIANEPFPDDELSIGPGGGAKMLKDINTALVRPVGHDHAQIEHGGLLHGLRAEKVMY